MSDNQDKEKTNPLMMLYTLGFIGVTLLEYSSLGLWGALGAGLIWPISVLLLLIK